MTNLKTITLSTVAALGLFAANASIAQDGARNVAEYNLADGVGLKGFDPVAVFPEGGGKALAGKPNHRLDHEGVTYFFANAENLETFESNPDKYEPTYGGWCAYAMASGSRVDIQPQLFTINGNRAHYFVAARAKRNFDADISDYEQRADGYWKQFSGEEPRL